MSVTLTESQRAAALRQARRHGMSLEQWLSTKARIAPRPRAESDPQTAVPNSNATSAACVTSVVRDAAGRLLTEEAIRPLFSPAAFNTGSFFAQQGCVEELRYHGGMLQVGMRDHRGRRFRAAIKRVEADGRWQLRGGCSCGATSNCEHIAAGVLASLRQLRSQQATKERSLAGADYDCTTPSADPRTPPTVAMLDAPEAADVVTAWLTRLREAVTHPPAAAGSQDAALIEAWEADVNSLPVPEQDEAAPGSQIILYFLSVGSRPGNRFVPAFGSALSRIRKDGTPGVEQSFSIWTLPMEAARHGLDSDVEIGQLIGQLAGVRQEQGEQRRTLMALYRQVLATGRCFWQDRRGVRLYAGPPRSLPLAWRAEADGRIALCVNPPTPEIEVIGGDVQMYVDTVDGAVGPIEIGLNPEVVRLLLTGPLVPAAQREQLVQSLKDIPRTYGSTWPVPLPPKRVNKVKKAGTPTPVLQLTRGPVRRTRERNPRKGATPEADAMDHVRLWFRYDDQLIDPRYGFRLFERLDPGRLTLIARDLAAEASAEDTLSALGLKAIDSRGFGAPYCLTKTRNRIGWSDILFRRLPELQTQGWEIQVDERFGHAVLDGSGSWLVDMEGLDESDDSSASGSPAGGVNDWLALSLDIEVDGERLPLLPILVHALQRLGEVGLDNPDGLAAGLERYIEGDTAYLDLQDGRQVALPAQRLRRFVNVLVELYEPGALDEAGRLRLPTEQAVGLTALEDAIKLRWFGGATTQSLIQRLKSFAGLAPMEPPAGFRAELRPYQRYGLAWLQFLREFGFGGVLADDMGLGKTPQALAHILTEKQAGRLDRPCLVVCPTSLVGNWLAEAARFTPDLSLLALHGPTRADRFDALPETDLVITTYPLLHRDEAQLTRQRWHIVVLDEAQAIKNPKAKATLVASRLHARHRVCLTGTPVENHLTELWSQFAFLMPGLLGKHRRFRSLYRTPIEKQADRDRLAGLQTRLRPFILRRTKAGVATDLPEKTEILRSVALSDEQRDLYETVRLALHERVREEVHSKGLAGSQIIILDALLKLRQVCCDPRLVKLEAARQTTASAKLDYLMDMMPTLLESGRRILLFSQFTQMLDLIKAAVSEAGLPFVELRGDTQDRTTPVQRFQAGEVPLFLISLKAGGTGLNLTAADTVIHYDPWWNPAVERQATDRAHRIGQDKGVFVYKLIAEGTIEERILRLQAEKAELADGLLAPGAVGSGALKPEDLDFLFDPLV